MSTQYVMRAFNTVLNDHVYWAVLGAPDLTGAFSGYNPANLTSITIDYSITVPISGFGGGTLPPGSLAGGDLGGTYPNPTVIKLLGRNLSLTAPNDGQVLGWVAANNDWEPVNGPTVSPATTISLGTIKLSGDLAGTANSPSVVKINGTSVPVGGALTVGNVPQVNGSSSLTYGPINLAGGANFVSGLLPAGNQAPQTLAGDATGVASSNTVVKIQGVPVSATGPTTGQVLEYNGTQWAPAANTPGGSAGGDLSGSYPNPTVAKLQGNSFTAGSPTKGQFVVATTTSSYGPVTISGDVSESPSTAGQLTVVGLQGRAVSSTAPASSQSLVFTGGQWTPTYPYIVFNVKNYGAAGDGITNDTAAFSSAIAAAGAVGASIYLPPGTYFINTNLTITTPIHFARGASISVGSSVTALSITGIIIADPTQNIFSGNSNTYTVNPSTTGPNLTITSPFAMHAAPIVVKITTGGTLGTMQFQYSINGGTSFVGPDFTGPNFATPSLSYTTSATSSYSWTVPGLGINILFPAGTYTSAATYTQTCGGILALGTNNNLSVKWFGALGNGVHDDTNAIQSVLSYFSANAAELSGICYFPAGTYNLSYTLNYMGNVGSAIKILGDVSGAEVSATGTSYLVWTGSAGVTMFDFYGINQSSFENIFFQGNGLAGCCTWFHTNQQQGGSPTNGVFFKQCHWSGVVGGLSVECAMSDSSGAPANITVDMLGHTTVTFCAGPQGSGIATHGNLVGQNCLLNSTIVSDTSLGSNTLQLTGPNPQHSFAANQSIWIYDSNGNKAYRTLVTSVNFSTNTLTLTTPLPFNVHAATTTVSVGFANAVALSTLSASATVTVASIANQNAEVADGIWEKCIFDGGSSIETFTTSGSPSYTQSAETQYCYACIAVYGGYNTEQFVFRDCAIIAEAACFGFYADAFLNNELYFENVQFGTFTSCGVGVFNSFVKAYLTECATESANTYHVGYFVQLFGSEGAAALEGCEVFNTVRGNPWHGGNGNYTGYVNFIAPVLKIHNCGVQEGDDVVSHAASGSAVDISGCFWSLPDAAEPQAVAQIPVFDSANNDISRALFAQTNYGQQGVVNNQVSLSHNQFAYHGAGPFNLPNQIGKPITVLYGGLITVGNSPNVTETYRNQTRVVSSRYDIDHTQIPTSGSVLYVAYAIPKTKILSAYIAVNTAFSTSTISVSMGTNTDAVPYTAWLPTTPLSTSGTQIIKIEDIPWEATWFAGTTTIGLLFSGTYVGQSTGQMTLYVTSEVGAP